MDNYMMFFGFGMFVIGLVVGRITMAIQYEVMKSLSREKAREKRQRKSFMLEQREPKKLEYKFNGGESSKKEFYEYMKRRPPSGI